MKNLGLVTKCRACQILNCSLETLEEYLVNHPEKLDYVEDGNTGNTLPLFRKADVEAFRDFVIMMNGKLSQDDAEDVESRNNPIPVNPLKEMEKHIADERDDG